MPHKLVVLLLVGVVARADCQSLLDRRLKDVEAWTREDTNDAQRVYFLALRHWKEHHWRQTDSLLRLAVQLEPRYADAYLALYYLPFSRRPQLHSEELRNHVPDDWKPVLDEANRFYRRAFRIDPMVNLQILSIAYDVKAPRALDMDPAEYMAYQRYFAWFDDLAYGHYSSAYTRLQKLAQSEFNEAKHPDNVPDFLIWFRGLSAAHVYRFDAAIADFRVLLARSLEQTQKDELIHVPLRDNEFRFALATLHQRAGHLDSAVALYQEALEHDLGLGMAHTDLANVYDVTHRPEQAVQERRRAAEVNNDDPAALFDLGAALFNWGIVTDAQEPLRRAIAVNARYAPPYYLLGRVDEELGLAAEARQSYTSFLALSTLRLDDWRRDAQQRLAALAK